MSNAFAIAAVTAAIRQLLSQSLEEAKAGGIVSANASVTAQAPDRIVLNDGAESRLNLFLYEISPNTGWINESLPSRSPDGPRITNPLLALDLSYLLSAYGLDDMEAEILLGYGMQLLHESPVLSQDVIRSLFDPGPPDGVGVLPRTFRQQAIKLADQVETIRISPRYLKTDEMSKIWASLQSHYRPSMGYQATVVLIERQRPVRTAPPVLTRGPRDIGPRAQANMLSPFPTLLDIHLPDQQPAARVDAGIKLFGHHLTGTNMVVHFRDERLRITLTAQGAALNIKQPELSPEQISENPRLRFADAQVEADLSQAAGVWSAGNYAVDMELVPEGDSNARRTNVLALSIAPAFAVNGPDAPIVNVGAGGATAITLTTTPAIQPQQAASLIVGGYELPMQPISTATNKPVFSGRLPSEMLVAGTGHLARLRVDGVESLYIKRYVAPKPPEFDPGQRITMP